MKRIAIEGKMGHGMGGKDLAVKKLFGFKDEANSIQGIFWALYTKLSLSQMCKHGFCKMGPCICPSYPAPEGPTCAPA